MGKCSLTRRASREDLLRETGQPEVPMSMPMVRQVGRGDQRRAAIDRTATAFVTVHSLSHRKGEMQMRCNFSHAFAAVLALETGPRACIT